MGLGLVVETLMLAQPLSRLEALVSTLRIRQEPVLWLAFLKRCSRTLTAVVFIWEHQVPNHATANYRRRWRVAMCSRYHLVQSYMYIEPTAQGRSTSNWWLKVSPVHDRPGAPNPKPAMTYRGRRRAVCAVVRWARCALGRSVLLKEQP
jgi:hypothetical protein